MPKIVIDARESGTSSGRYVDKLIEHLHALQPAHEFVILTKPQRVAYLEHVAPSWTVIPSPHKEFTVAEQLSLKSQIEALQPALVHFAFVQQPVLYRGLKVTTMHDLTTLRFRNPAKNALVFAFKQQVYAWVNKHAARTSSAVIAISQYTKDDVVRFTGVSPDKITVTLESADDLPQPADAVPGLDDQPFIMYVGRPTPHKNLERLIQAFGILQKDHPDLHLVLAGKKDANYQRIETDAQQQGIANVVFTDFITDNQLRWLYEHCRTYVFPSLSEGFGLPGLEAMRHGAPVVSSNATCLPEVHGEAALYFEPRNADDMAAKIAVMIDNEALRQQYIKRGYEQISKYSWQRMAQQTLAVYEQALRSRS